MTVPNMQETLLLMVQQCETVRFAMPVKLNGVGAEGFELCYLL